MAVVACRPDFRKFSPVCAMLIPSSIISTDWPVHDSDDGSKHMQTVFVYAIDDLLGSIGLLFLSANQHGDVSLHGKQGGHRQGGIGNATYKIKLYAFIKGK